MKNLINYSIWRRERAPYNMVYYKSIHRSKLSRTDNPLAIHSVMLSPALEFENSCTKSVNRDIRKSENLLFSNNKMAETNFQLRADSNALCVRNRPIYNLPICKGAVTKPYLVVRCPINVFLSSLQIPEI